GEDGSRAGPRDCADSLTPGAAARPSPPICELGRQITNLLPGAGVPGKACGQAAVRSHTRTDRIAARTVSSEPEIENLDPLSRVVVSRRPSCALHHSAIVCLRSYPYGPK